MAPHESQREIDDAHVEQIQIQLSKDITDRDANPLRVIISRNLTEVEMQEMDSRMWDPPNDLELRVINSGGDLGIDTLEGHGLYTKWRVDHQEKSHPKDKSEEEQVDLDKIITASLEGMATVLHDLSQSHHSLSSSQYRGLQLTLGTRISLLSIIIFEYLTDLFKDKLDVLLEVCHPNNWTERGTTSGAHRLSIPCIIETNWKRIFFNTLRRNGPGHQTR
ncbi:3942_t:CDS:2 [Acaulospora colombiana]|uniref:3942_t:CDS:1 n=1 Tax=Acaulospora colombiana TaxID=27376 RepID=A0ACA9NG04_9GLOM|nr:3942_t:CDS:2 [Acaulospora colombiana]